MCEHTSSRTRPSPWYLAFGLHGALTLVSAQQLRKEDKAVVGIPIVILENQVMERLRPVQSYRGNDNIGQQLSKSRILPGSHSFSLQPTHAHAHTHIPIVDATRGPVC